MALVVFRVVGVSSLVYIGLVGPGGFYREVFRVVKDFLIELPLLGAISLPLGEESIKRCTLYSPDNIANLSIFCRKKVGALS